MKKTAATLAVLTAITTAMGNEINTTRIAKWRGDAKGALILYYDDGCDSVVDFAIPSLLKHNITGTFYLCFGWFDGKPEKMKPWLEAAKHPNLVFANHTWSHVGAKDAAHAEEEIARNDKVLRKTKQLRADELVSFCIPGGTKWEPTREENEAIYKKYNIIHRPPTERVAGRSINTAADILKLADRAENEGVFETVIFHGVGGDWFKFSAAEHELAIRGLAKRQAGGTLWVAATVALQKYTAERDAAKITTTSQSEKQINLELSIGTPAQYDEPLTLVTTVPAGWESATIKQGDAVWHVPVINGTATYDVAPVAGAVAVLRK